MTPSESLSSGQQDTAMESLLSEMLNANEVPPYWEDALVALLSRIHEHGHSSEARLAAEMLRDRIAQSIQAAEPLAGELGREGARKAREIDSAMERLARQREHEDVSLGLSPQEKATLRERIEAGEPIPVQQRTDVLLLFLNLASQIWGSTRLFKLLFLLGKETEVGQYVPDYYGFAGGRFGPFEKRIYQDVEGLKQVGLVKASMPPRRRDELEPELDVELLSGSVEAVYELTSRGHMYARALARHLELQNPALLAEVRGICDKFGRISLAKLLEYVYKKYPEYTDQSEIRDEILANQDETRLEY